jgi:hypothetical protein
MPDPNNQTPTGLPPGAVVGPPLQQNAPTGLPPGAIVGPPLQSSEQHLNPAGLGEESVRTDQSVGVGEALKQAGQGVLGGVLQTTSGLGGLIHSIPGVGPAIIPSEGLMQETAKARELTQTPLQKVGEGAETIAEFSGGEEALGLLGKLGKVPTVLLELAEKYPKTAKLLMSMTKGATVAGGQGAVKESAPGGAGTLKGAEAGAIGGAVGGAGSELVGAVAKPVGEAMGVGTSAEQDAMRAAQPGKRNYRFIEDWGLAKDRLVDELEQGGKFKDFQDAADRIGDVRQKLWNSEVKPAVDKHAAEELFPANVVGGPVASVGGGDNPVSRSIRSRVTPAMQKVNKQSATAIEKFAQKFDGPMNIGDAEQTLEHMNAELTDMGYWKKTPPERAAAEKANPAIASRVAATQALRDSLYDRLDTLGEKGIQDLKREYGAIANIEKEIRGQVNVQGRQRPISLKQIIGLTAGISHGGALGAAATVAPLLDKLYNDPVELLNRGVSKSAPDSAVTSAVKDVARGTAIVGKKAAPALTGQLVRFMASDGSIHDIPSENLDEAKKRDKGLQVMPGQ